MGAARCRRNLTTEIAMALMKWDDMLSVKVESIDAQHKKLIAILNRVHDAARSGNGASIVGPILDELVSYTDEHFAFEEDLMRRAEYPDLANHCLEHERLTARLGEWRTAPESADSTPQRLLGFLVTWLSTHIMETDKRYTPFVQRLDEPASTPHSA
jgi:hemerythrin